LNIRIYVVFEAFLLRYDLAQLRECVPPSLFNDVIKLLGVRVPVIANFYDPTTFLFLITFFSQKHVLSDAISIFLLFSY